MSANSTVLVWPSPSVASKASAWFSLISSSADRFGPRADSAADPRVTTIAAELFLWRILSAAFRARGSANVEPQSPQNRFESGLSDPHLPQRIKLPVNTCELVLLSGPLSEWTRRLQATMQLYWPWLPAMVLR